MTENESLSLLGKSPFETASELLWYTNGGRVRAQRLAVFQLRSLLSMSRVLPLPVCFWAEVFRRVGGLLDSEVSCPGRFQMARFECIEARMAR